MLQRQAAAPARHITATEAAALVQSGMWLDYGAVLAQPDAFDAALALRKADLTQVKIRACVSTKPRAVLEADPDGAHFFWVNLHFSGYDRRKHDAGRASYLPVNLGEIPDYYRRFIEPVDILIVKTGPMDADGNFNLGLSNLWHRAVAERARTVIIETSAAVPHAYGVQNALHISEVDYIINGEDQPMAELPNPPATDVDRAVARHILAEIEDGACLQIGIGGMPNAVCSQLVASDIKDLGCFTEMLTDGIIDLYRAGKLTGIHNTLNPGKVVYSFGLGSRLMYETVDKNPDFLCCPADYTNLPHIIMQNRKMVTINNTTQMDLQGQAASESDGFRHISGTGGQLQFVRGAYAAPEGKSFICLASTYEKRGERRSRIVLGLTKANIVTTPRTDLMYVVTEYGMANLKGKSVPERAKAMISLAHPDFRAALEREAYDERLIPRGFF